MNASRSMSLNGYRPALDAVHAGVYVVGPDRQIVIWNRAAAKMTGHASADVEGHRCGDTLLAHVDSEGRPMCHGRCPLAATLADGLQRDAEVFLRHRNGHRVAVNVHVERLVDEGGTVLGAIESFIDARPAGDHAPSVTHCATDPLTGLSEADAVIHRLRILLAESKVFGIPITGVLVRVDAGDTGGAEASSAASPALRSAAQTLAAAFPPGLVARRDAATFLAIDPQTVGDPETLAARAAALVGTCCVGDSRDAPPLSARAVALASLPVDDVGSFLWRLDQAMLALEADPSSLAGDFVGV